MTSPFPGMDPYLDAWWGDVSASVLVYGSHALNSRLPDDLRARIDHREWIGDDEILRSRYLKILQDDGRVITTVEFFGPQDKRPGPLRDWLRRDQAERSALGINQVEIDLRRDGDRVSLFDRFVPDPDRSAYLGSIWRAGAPSSPVLFRLSLRERLPILPIPLRDSDDDIPLDLQALIDRAYANGRYDHTDYRADPIPPLSGADAAWADGLLRGRGLR
ncbi:DUF4058 family protein [Tautonia sp. JC769]|uniref:DUF4058 family protein n=1 Tax=Tautonia sp. JC769 TaxID=3232135 RepID=UPI003457A1C3